MAPWPPDSSGVPAVLAASRPGPDSSLAPLIAAAVLPLAAGSDAEAVALAGMLAILSGLLCVLAGLARFGFIAGLLSKPVRYGYMNGIALTVQRWSSVSPACW
jgi:MFS superfamily sulfate permease-like transporter